MTEERLQEIKDSVEFQYAVAKAQGVDNALLFTNEEEELIEEVERLNKELELQKLKLEDTKKELIGKDKYIDKLKIEYDKKLEFERQIKKEVREYVSEIIVDEIYTKCILEILDKAGE